MKFITLLSKKATNAITWSYKNLVVFINWFFSKPIIIVIGLMSIIIAVNSFLVSRESLTIANKTSERDSKTSIQMRDNRKRDSTFAFRNNERDSNQQAKMVHLLVLYDSLADQSLKAQMELNKPLFNVQNLEYKDSIIQNDISYKGKYYRLPILLFKILNGGNRAAFNFEILCSYYFPESNQIFRNSIIKLKNPIAAKSELTQTIHLAVPSIDHTKFFIKISLSWEDQINGVKKDSIGFIFTLLKLSKSKFIVYQITNPDDNTMLKIEKQNSFIDVPEEVLLRYTNIFYKTYYHEIQKKGNHL